MLAEIRSNNDKINNILALGDALINFSDLRAQGICAKYLAIMAAGHIELITQQVLFEYSKRRSHISIANFILKSIEWENSLNCEKIKKILDKFDKEKCNTIFENMDTETKESIDSLKNLRDILAHGGDNGVSIGTVRKYHAAVQRFSALMHDTYL